MEENKIGAKPVVRFEIRSTTYCDDAQVTGTGWRVGSEWVSAGSIRTDCGHVLDREMEVVFKVEKKRSSLMEDRSILYQRV